MNTNTEDLERELDKAWLALFPEAIEYARQIATENGPGSIIFRMKHEVSENGANCSTYFAEYKSVIYESILGSSTQGGHIQSVYDPNSMFMVVLQIPSIANPTDMLNSVRIFKVDDLEEISIVEKAAEMALPERLAHLWKTG